MCVGSSPTLGTNDLRKQRSEMAERKTTKNPVLGRKNPAFGQNAPDLNLQ
jgi:hypothetical protein